MVTKSAQSGFAQDPTDLTPRQGEVLGAALDYLVRTGGNMTMGEVARAASCSKETLYNWFGDREGLLVATVRWQAGKVKMPDMDLQNLDGALVRSGLTRFGVSLLGVLVSRSSVALNRLAISQSGTDQSQLGNIVLQNGRFAMGRRLKPLFEAAHRAGILQIGDSETAYQVYFGLLLRDTQIRLLLGDRLAMDRREIRRRAEEAAGQFIRIFSGGPKVRDRLATTN